MTEESRVQVLRCGMCECRFGETHWTACPFCDSDEIEIVDARILNGYPVVEERYIGRQSATRESRVILVDRGEDLDFHRWVTALHCEDDREWMWGNYITDAGEALADLQRRWSRNR